MPTFIYQYVFRLQISEKNVLLVDILDAENELRANELCQLLIEKLVGVKLLSQVTVFAQLHNHVQILRSLERKVQP